MFGQLKHAPEKPRRRYRVTAYWPLYGMPHPIPCQFQTFSCPKLATSKADAVRQLLAEPFCIDPHEPDIFLPTASIIRVMVEEMADDEPF